MVKKISLMMFLLVLVPLLYASDSLSDSTGTVEGDYTRSHILILDITGDIGTVTADRVIEAVDQAEEERADLLLLIMDTPGGFVTATWEITRAIMNSNVPVAVYISPLGARAGSAGVFIAYSAQISAMAPGTNIGAAHVVGGQGQAMDSVLSEKMTNDAAANIRSMAEHYGRNADWAEEAVRKSVSITDSVAIANNVVDLRAKNVDDLLQKINGRVVKMATGTKTVKTTNPVKTPIEKTFFQRILELISSPNIVFLLFSIGGLGIAMEIYNPGSILPGVVGGICLILAFYGTRFLPVNYAGVLLILFAIILFVLEIKIVSHGLLTVGGVISIILGGIMLIDTADPELKVSKSIIFSVAIVIGAFVFFAFYFVYKARISQPSTGKEGLIGHIGVVKTKIEGSGYIYLAGELWEAEADESIEVGEKVEVLEVNNLKMKVKKKS